jgi:hypothetical protein
VALWDYGGEFRTLAIIEPGVPDNRRVRPGQRLLGLYPDGAPKSMTRD